MLTKICQSGRLTPGGTAMRTALEFSASAHIHYIGPSRGQTSRATLFTKMCADANPANIYECSEQISCTVTKFDLPQR